MFHVDKVYKGDIVALDDVSLQIESGEFVFLTGPSGAGKSTLLKLILCAERATRGQIVVNKLNITRIKRSRVPYLRRQMGFVFQDFKLLERLTVFENVAFALTSHRLRGKRNPETGRLRPEKRAARKQGEHQPS